MTKVRRCDGATVRWCTSAIAAFLVAATLVAAQTRAYKAPRTPDGQPDLQGFWTNATYTPLERPDGVTKALYTPEEAEAAIKLAMQRESAQTEPGTTADVHYDFSQFGLDRSQSLFVRNLRTSLIVDPPTARFRRSPTKASDARRSARRSRRNLAGDGTRRRAISSTTAA